MADLKARFSLVDDMSDRMSQIGESGLNMMEAWEQAGEAASSAIDGVASSATQTATTVDGVAHSIDEINNSAGNASGAADDLSTAMSNLDNAMSEAAAETDHWTAAAQNYDKSALEMIYTTEELVEMGLKTADALGNVDEMYELCESAAEKLNSELENSVAVHEALSEAAQSAERVMEEFADSGRISAETSERLEEANTAATKAIEELETAQNEAKAAMDAYDETIISGTTNLDELSAAAERAGTAASNLAAANEKASKATEELSQASQEAAESAESSGEQGVKAIEAVAETIIAAKIVEKVEEIAEACYELADAYSESQKIIVNATGATGDTLNGLEQSMMNAYSNNKKDLETTAAAIGEINTRMGLQGGILTDVTGKFLDYSTVTGSNVVNSVANVTKIMNKWNVEQENVGNVLDKLVYASQMSGASVDSLSSTLISGSGAFQQMDLSLDNTISLLSSLELYGLNGSTALMAMRTAVKHFSDEGEDAGAGLRRVIDEIANMESAAEATALACEVFGSRAGVEMSNAIRNGAISVETLNGSLDAAQGSLEKTAQAGETLSEKWEKSNNKIKTAFTSALQPTIDKMSAGLAKVTGGIGDFLNKHPFVTKALVAIAAGVAAATVAVAAIAVSMLTAIPAVAAFGAAVHAALGPIGWIAAGATALVGGILLLSSAFSNSKEEVEDYNGTMEECQAELQRTEAAYEKACELYGENSSAAQELSDNLSTLNAQFEKGGGAAAVYAEKARKLAESFNEISSSQQKAIEEIDKTETSGLTAIAMLSALSEQSSHTNADLDIMANYADYLNDTFNCDIKVNYTTGELTGFDPKIITDAVIQAASDERYQTALDYLSGADFQDSYMEAKRNVHDLGIELDQLYRERDYGNNWTSTGTTTTTTVDNVDANANANKKRSAKEINDDIARIEQALADYQATLTQAEADIQTYGILIDETGRFTETYTEILDNMCWSQNASTAASGQQADALSEEVIGIQAAASEWQKYQIQIEELCTAYDEVYQAALDSFQGQFSLFDQASTTSEKYLSSTVANAQAALDSQLNYWTTYGQNIEILKNTSAADLGITEENYNALMSYVQNGSEEAAGLAASMVTEIQGGHKEAVTELANTVAEVSAKQEEIAASTADWITDFSSQMDEIVSKMNSTIDDMDLSTEANTAATNTIKSYAAAITANGGAAVAAAQSIARQVQAALSSADTTINIGVNSSVPGHATGTTDAEDVFVAGENGPELIVGKAGSTVFPTSETNKIISALEGMGGTEYNRTSYATTTATTNNSTSTTNYSKAVENYDQRETTEISNNYTTIENDSTYDDDRIITILTGFLDVFSALEKKIDTKNSAETPEIKVDAYETGTTASEDTFIAGEKGPELIVGQPDSMVFPTEETNKIIKAIAAYSIEPYDFSDIEKNLSRSSGDTYSVNTIRNYNTEYGDAIRNIDNAETINYGDNVRSFEESVRGGDSSYNTFTSYGDEKSYTASADTTYGDKFDSEINYGDIIRNANEEISSSNDRAYAETINYGDNVRSFEESVTNAQAERYNSINSANSNSAESYYSSNGGNNINDSTDYGDTVKNYVESILSNRESKLYNSNEQRNDYINVQNGYSNIANSLESNSNAYESRNTNSYTDLVAYNSKAVEAVTRPLFDNDISTVNYGNSFESVQNTSKAASNISKSTTLTSNSESHSDSVSVLSEAIKNSSVENSQYENALTTLGNEIINNSDSTEQAIQNMESLTNGETFNTNENNVERMEQSITNDNRAYETAENTNNISRQAYYNTSNSYGGSEYIDSRETSAAYQSNDNRAFGDTTAYGDSIRNFESSYINTDNTPQAFENSSESVFIPLMGIISVMLEKAFSDNLRAVETNQETFYSVGNAPEEETTLSFMPEFPIIENNDTRTVAEQGVEHRNGSDDKDGKDENDTAENVKRIVLEIAGSGSIDISDGVDEEKVLELIEENMKPVLMNIIQSEIYEEGDMSYDF